MFSTRVLSARKRRRYRCRVTNLANRDYELVWDDSLTVRVRRVGPLMGRNRPLAWLRATRDDRGDVTCFDIYADAPRTVDRLWVGRASSAQVAVEFCDAREGALEEMTAAVVQARAASASGHELRQLIEEGHRERLADYEPFSWRPCTRFVVVDQSHRSVEEGAS